MSEPFLAEIKMVGFNFAPRGWTFCDGQILPINQNQSLYSLLGTTYGGDGRTTFGLPDLRGRTPIHTGQNGSSGGHTLGQKSGEENHTLSIAEMPNHDHVLRASSAPANSNNPSGNVWAAAGVSAYHSHSAANQINMAANAVGNAGTNQGHNNMQPYLTVAFCIALQGLFPS